MISAGFGSEVQVCLTTGHLTALKVSMWQIPEEWRIDKLS